MKNEFKVGDRVVATQVAGFHKGARGEVKFVEPGQHSIIWVLRDNATTTCYYYSNELELDTQVTLTSHITLAESALDKWDYRFLRLAREVATWSKDPSTKVGAVLVSPDRQHIALGYNGFPKGMEDRAEWYEDREEKYSRVIHAEKNAKANAGVSIKGWTQYTWPFASCDRCCVEMCQEGVARFVAPRMTPEIEARWGPIVAKSRKYAAEMNRRFDEVEFPTVFTKEL